MESLGTYTTYYINSYYLLRIPLIAVSSICKYFFKSNYWLLWPLSCFELKISRDQMNIIKWSHTAWMWRNNCYQLIGKEAEAGNVRSTSEVQKASNHPGLVCSSRRLEFPKKKVEATTQDHLSSCNELHRWERGPLSLPDGSAKRVCSLAISQLKGGFRYPS